MKLPGKETGKGRPLSELTMFISLGLVLTAYLVVRAIYIPLAHDEAATWFFFVQTGEFIPGLHYFDANNHILNSFLTWISYSLFGASKLALRLPNLLFFPVWLYFSYRSGRLVRKKSLRWIFWLGMLMAHSLIEFFALSRGYGMSMALLLASLWYLHQFTLENTTARLIKVLGLACLACLANLTLLIPLGAMGLLLMFIVLKGNTGKVRSVNLLTLFLMGFLPALAFTTLLLKMRAEGMLYYGSSGNPMQQSFPSTIRFLFDTRSALAAWAFLTMMAVSIAMMIFFLLKKKDPIHKSPAGIFSWLFLSSLLAILFLGLVMGVNYPEDRTSLYFLPLLIGSIIFLADELSEHTRWWIIPGLAILVLPVHFILNMNTSHSGLWGSISPPESFAQRLQEAANPGEVPPTISGHSLNLLCWEYFNQRMGGSLNQVQTSDYPGQVADYMIAYPYEMEERRDLYSEILKDSISGLWLWKRDPRMERKLITRVSVGPQKNIRADTLDLFTCSTDTLSGESLLLAFDLKIESPERPFKGWLVCAVYDDSGQRQRYELIVLNWKRKQWLGESARYSMYIPDIPDGGGRLDCFLLNREEQPFSIWGSLTLSILTDPGK